MKSSAVLLFALAAAVATPGYSQAVRDGFDSISIPTSGINCDLDFLDCSSPSVSLGFTVNFFGVSYSSVYVNSHGNLTFGSPRPSSYVPDQESFEGLDVPLIAPFFADNDMRANNQVVRYGTGTVNGRPAFGATYRNQGYFERHEDKLNTFQVILISRSDIGPGYFDIEFNYNTINWEASGPEEFSQGGANGLCAGRPNCVAAAAGFSNGIPAFEGGRSYLLPGSFTPGAFLDSNPNGLRFRTQGSSGVPGRLVFEVRGLIITSCETPTATVGAAYTGRLVATGGTPTYNWGNGPITGTVPPGLQQTSGGIRHAPYGGHVLLHLAGNRCDAGDGRGRLSDRGDGLQRDAECESQCRVRRR
jgi:hypothetical protein